MEKEYWGDVYFFTCPACGKNNVGAAYYAIFTESEMGAAKRSGKITYPCKNDACKKPFPADRVNGEANKVSKEEALKNGLIWESRAGSA
jgi:hypothetical protein